MGTFHSVNHWKTLQYPKTQSWSVAIFAGSCLDQQMVLWNKSSSECFWDPATLSADVVSAAMTVYVNRGSRPRSVLPDVQCGVTKLSSLPCGVSTATLIYFCLWASQQGVSTLSRAQCEAPGPSDWVVRSIWYRPECPWPGSSSSELATVCLIPHQNPTASSLNFEKNKGVDGMCLWPGMCSMCSQIEMFI